MEEQLVQEVGWEHSSLGKKKRGGLSKGKGGGRESYFLEKYKECLQLYKEMRQFRAAILVGDRGKGPRKQVV